MSHTAERSQDPAPSERGAEYEVVYRAPVGARLAVLAAAAGVLATLALLWNSAENLPRFLAAVVCVAATAGLLRWAQHRRIPVLGSVEALEKLAERTGIPIVLYLRRFADDTREEHAVEVSGSDETEFASYLARNCLLVALGRPGEPLPPEGAYRLYLSESDWQPEVQRLIDLSSLVLIRYVASPSVAWEVEQLVDRGKVDRTILLLPRSDQREDGYEVREHLPPGFPSAEASPAAKGSGGYPAFLTFRDGACRTHARPTGLRYGQAASNLLEEVFPEIVLTKEQRSLVRGFYGGPERVLASLITLALSGLVVCGAGAILLVAMILAFALTDGYALSRALADVLFPFIDAVLTPLGVAFVASLVVALGGAWLSGRMIP